MNVDKGRRTTDNELRTMEKKLKAMYSRAQKELEKEWKEYMNKADEKSLDLYIAIGKAKTPYAKQLAEQKYKDFVKNMTLRDEHYKTMVNQYVNALLEVNERAVAYVNDMMPTIYTTNFNAIGTGIESQVKGYSFEMVDEATVKSLATKDKTLLPYKKVNEKKDVRWNTSAVNSEVLQGILQGESIPKIAARLENVTAMNLTSAIRNARTSTTCAENRGRMDSFREAQKKGVVIHKIWMATEDGRTREAHVILDGQEREIDEPFDSELGKIMYPGDPDADPSNVYNCRCTMVTKVLGFESSRQTQDETDSFVKYISEKKYSPNISDYKSVDDYWQAKKDWEGDKTRYIDDIFDPTKLKTQTDWISGDSGGKIPRIESTIVDLNDRYPAFSTGDKEYGIKLNNLVVCDYDNAWLHLPDGESDRRLSDSAAQVFINPKDNTAIMAFNRPHLYGSIEDALQERENVIKNGEVLLSIGGANPEITVMHEWGHIMSNHLDNAMVYQDETVVAYWNWYKSLTKDEIKHGLSDYATTNRGEFEAECFAELQMPNPRPLAVKFKEYLDEIIKKGY